MVEGGDILEERVRSARETAKRPVGGFCLDGFQTGSMDWALRTQLINAVTKELPEDKPRSAVSKHSLTVEYWRIVVPLCPPLFRKANGIWISKHSRPRTKSITPKYSQKHEPAEHN